MQDINLYPEMNREIVKILRLSEDNPMNLYAAKLIEEQEKELSAYRAAEQSGRITHCPKCGSLNAKHLFGTEGEFVCMDCLAAFDLDPFKGKGNKERKSEKEVCEKWADSLNRVLDAVRRKEPPDV